MNSCTLAAKSIACKLFNIEANEYTPWIIRPRTLYHPFSCAIVLQKLADEKRQNNTSSKIWPKFLFEQLPNKKYVHRPWQSIFLVDCSICELSVIVCISFVDISWMKCINKERKHVSLSPKIIKYINFWSWLAIVFFCLHQ